MRESRETQRKEVQGLNEHTENSPRPYSWESGALRNKETEGPMQKQAIAENAHNETKSGLLETYKDSIPEARQEELESSATSERLKVLSEEDYSKKFPGTNPLVMGHCDSEGNIYIKAVSENAISHISTHETTHLCSNRESGINEKGNWSIKSGLRECEFGPNRQLVSDTGRGVNEGATEMYTLRELKRRGEAGAAQEFEAYSQPREWTERLEQIVGEDKLADAYFGGQKESMIKEFNRLDSEQSDAWEQFSKNVDIVEYSSDAKEVQCAQQELAAQYLRMILEKDLTGEMDNEG